jgi:hypothetical protein
MLCLVQREGRVARNLFYNNTASCRIDETAGKIWEKSKSVTSILSRHLFNDTTDDVQCCLLLICSTSMNDGSVKNKSSYTKH